MASLPPHMPPISGVNAILKAHLASEKTSSIKPTVLALFSMHSKVAIITGGGRGIGLEIALAYAEAGARVYCLDLPEKPSEEWGVCKAWVNDLSGEGGKRNGALEYTQCDVTQQRATWDIVARIAEKEGRLDVCVACAGILRGSDVLEWDGDDWEKLMKVNVSGVLFTAQAAGRQMAARGIKGSIILIASMSGRITNPDMHWAAYNTSKSAVLQLSRSIACELGPKGIRCNTISPGYVYTAMTKAFLDNEPNLMNKWCAQNALGRLANPDEMRGIALFLGSDASTFCTGSDLVVDGGQTAW
ncbi:hypothetical protein D9619_013481 [Psilocybe cf. subviscida]|uniref:Sorbose reductase sou1 n=1 Tax=Psilocybe cf. subviscida TaxID=2480587 RepID=A0A8H5BHN1_9AGAR|nr:hypothetical protein D9619_013481 [Psilocybe cf. subviscida]